MKWLRVAPSLFRASALMLGCLASVAAGATENRDSAEAPLAPWTAIQVVQSKIRLTDKTIDIDRQGFPASIAVAGTEILAAPLEVTFPTGRISDGDEASPAPWQSPGGDFAGFSHSIAVTSGSEKVDIQVDAEFAYDGLLTWTLSTRQVPQAWIGHDVQFRIRVASNLAKLMHRYGSPGTRNVELETADRDEFSSGFLPFIWLGDDEHGLFWLSERRFGPERNVVPNTLVVRRDGKEWILEWRVPINASNSWTHSFSLMPTPPKPLPRGWRDRRMWPASKSSTYVIWPDEKGYDAAYFGFPEARNASGLRKYLTGLHRERRAGAPYVCPTWASTQLPAWASHGNEWGKGPRESLRESRWGGEFVQVCPASTSWLNVARPSYAKFIQDYRLTAIYLDNAQAYVTRGCLNPEESGAAVEFPMLGQRRIYRAIVQDLRQNGPQTDAVVHSSGGINLPSFSMVDSLVTGEHYRGVVKDDYLDVASLTDFRIELNSQRWGLTTHFLPEFPQGIRDAVLPTRKLMAILLLHDVRPWPKWCNVGEVNRALAAIDLFGVSDASFVAYYVTSPLAVSKAGQLKISGYQDGDRTLLIAANLTKAAVDGQICLADRLSSPTVQVETWPKPTPLALNHGCINVSVDPGDYALFRIASRSSAAPLH